MRPTSSVVLPVPAAASTISVLSSSRGDQLAILGDAPAAAESARHGIFLNASRSAKSFASLRRVRRSSSRPHTTWKSHHSQVVGAGPRRQRAVLDRAIDDLEHLEAALRRLAHQRNLVRLKSAGGRAEEQPAREHGLVGEERLQREAVDDRLQHAAAVDDGLARLACGSCRSCDR